ncbi:MAG TPA: GDSL-type esterase/lipase family protein [Gemmatimonadaceae bacterium]|nr:GDSL-type esterase/lipase family protein [Gemmatimonadaceae bacterium]
MFRVRPAAWQSLVASVALAGVLRAQSAPPAQAPDPARFKAAIDGFLKEDKASPPAPLGIEFIGSSIFAQWKDVAKDMAPLPAYNRAFGGSQTPDLLFYEDKVVLPYHPRFLVYYCGSNDVNANRPAAEIIANIRTFHERLQKAYPNTRMFFVSVIRAPQKRSRWAVVDSVNAAMRAYARTAHLVEFIDVNPVLLDAAGNVRGELYVDDSLHYRPPAYQLFTSVIKPVLQRAWTAK